MAFTNKARPEWVNVREYGIQGDPAVLITQAELNNVFNVAISRNRPVFFPNGTYVFPANFNFVFGMNDVMIIGEDREHTIITTAWAGDTVRIPERIDISLPKTQPDGFYRIDITGVPDTSWSALVNPDIDDYVKIVGGVASFATLAEIKAANYLTELDVNQPDPGIDGKYVVAATNTDVGGGGYTHSDLPYNTAIKYVTGTMLTRTSGVWARMVPSKGFEFGGNFYISDIQFRDVAFYIFTPNNITTPDFDHYIIDNCIFKHVIRVNAHDRQYASTAIQTQGFVRGSWYHLDDGQSFNYKKLQFTNNICSYIHTCIFWEMPPMKELKVTGNKISDCYTFTELFIYMPMGASTTDDSEDLEGYTNKTFINYDNNDFINCRHYSPVSHGGHHMMRGNGRGSYKNNRFINCTGAILYMSGNNNAAEGNIIVPYLQNYPDKEALIWGRPAIFHVKTGNQSEVSSTLISNNKVEKAAQIDIVDIKNTNTFININGNKLMNIGYAEQIIPSDTTVLNRELLHLIRDVPTFKTLAGVTSPAWAAGVYVSGNFVDFGGTLYQCIKRTSAGDLDPAADISTNGVAGAKWRAIPTNTFVYWDIRRKTWMYWPSSQARDSGFIDKNYDGSSDFPINAANNVIFAYNIFNMVDGFIEDVNLTNNDIFIDRDLISQSTGSTEGSGGYGAYVNNVKLYNNRIYRNNVSISTKYFNSLNTIVAINNDFYYSTTTLDISFRRECHWINNRVKPWAKFAKSANVSVLGLPGSGINNCVTFKRTLPSAWVTATAYTTGKYVSYNGQVYQAIADVLTTDGAPDVTTAKWSLVDDPFLYIKDGSFDSYLARTAALTWSNLNRVVIDGTMFNVRLINDWGNLYRTVAAGGQSARFAIGFFTANANVTRDLHLSNLKFDFENRDNRFLFFATAANCLNVTNLAIDNIPAFGAYPINKAVYLSTGGTIAINKLALRSADHLLDDTYFESAIVAKEFQNRYSVTLTTNGSYQIPKGVLIDKIVVNSSIALPSFKIGTTAGGAEISDQALDAGVNTIYELGLFTDTAMDLHFTGITASTKITIFKR